MVRMGRREGRGDLCLRSGETRTDGEAGQKDVHCVPPPEIIGMISPCRWGVEKREPYSPFLPFRPLLPGCPGPALLSPRRRSFLRQLCFLLGFLFLAFLSSLLWMSDGQPASGWVGRVMVEAGWWEPTAYIAEVRGGGREGGREGEREEGREGDNARLGHVGESGHGCHLGLPNQATGLLID